jgi:hypothetical protein
MSDFKYEYNNLPILPFNVYFLDHEGRASPKKVYTVTRKQYHSNANCFELYILELEEYIVYDAARVVPVAGISVNENDPNYLRSFL